MRNILFCLFIFTYSNAHASSVKNTSQFSSTSFSNYINGSYNKEEPWTFDLGVGVSNSSSTSSGVTTNYQSTSLTTNVDYEFSSKTVLGGGINFSNEKTDQVIGVESHLTIGQTFEFDSKSKHESVNTAQLEDIGEDDFSKFVFASLEFASNRLLQQGAGPRRLGGPQAEAPSITQKSVSLNLTSMFIEWFKISFGFTKYDYDKDVGAYLAQLLNPRNSGFTPGITNSLSSLMSYQNSVVLDFFIASKWNIKLAGTMGQEAINGDRDTNISLKLAYDLTDSWVLGLGAGNSMAGTSGSNYGVASVKFRF